MGSSEADGQDTRGVRANGAASSAERGSGSGPRGTARWQADRVVTVPRAETGDVHDF